MSTKRTLMMTLQWMILTELGMWPSSLLRETASDMTLAAEGRLEPRSQESERKSGRESRKFGRPTLMPVLYVFYSFLSLLGGG